MLDKERSLLLKSVTFKQFLLVSIPISVRLLFIDQCNILSVKCHCDYWLIWLWSSSFTSHLVNMTEMSFSAPCTCGAEWFSGGCVLCVSET